MTTSECGDDSLDLTQVLIQPRDDLPHKIGSLLRDVVRGVQHDSLFFRCRRAEHVEQRVFPEEDPVEFAGNEENRRHDVGCEIGLVRPGQRLIAEESTIGEDHCLETVFHPGKYHPNAAPMLSPM